MKELILPIFLSLALVACSGAENSETQDGEEGSTSTSSTIEFGDCDPLLAEYATLLDDYKNGLQKMIDEKELDQDLIEEWSKEAEELGNKIEEKGEKELGLKCWEEFNEVSERYGNEIAPLAVELAKIEMQKYGLDMDVEEMMEQAQEEQ